MGRRRKVVAGLVATLAIGAAPGAEARTPAGTTIRQLEGRVTSVDRERRTFRLRTENGSRVRIRVTSRTHDERLPGFSALRRGLAVEVTARRRDRGWVARHIERRRAEDRRGRDDHGGHDDHGGDDRGRDD